MCGVSHDFNLVCESADSDISGVNVVVIKSSELSCFAKRPHKSQLTYQVKLTFCLNTLNVSFHSAAILRPFLSKQSLGKEFRGKLLTETGERDLE
jgi:hypothetical protein